MEHVVGSARRASRLQGKQVLVVVYAGRSRNTLDAQVTPAVEHALAVA